MESSLLWSLERGLGIALQAVLEKKAVMSRKRGRLVGFLQLWRQYQISHEVQRGAQRASRVVLGTSGLRACGEGECMIALKS